MKREQLEDEVSNGDHDEAYADYLINKSGARIGNGDMLIEAMESGNYFDEFVDELEGK